MRTLTLLALVLLGGCDFFVTPPPAQSMIRIVNRSSATITELFYAECGAATWGENRIADEQIATNTTREFVVPSGCYDIRAETTSGTVQRGGIEIASNMRYVYTLTD